MSHQTSETKGSSEILQWHSHPTAELDANHAPLYGYSLDSYRYRQLHDLHRVRLSAASADLHSNVGIGGR